MPRRSPEPSKFDQNMQLLNTIIGLGQTGMGIYGGIQNRRLQQRDQDLQEQRFGLDQQKFQADQAEQARLDEELNPAMLSLLGYPSPSPQAYTRRDIDMLQNARQQSWQEQDALFQEKERRRLDTPIGGSAYDPLLDDRYNQLTLRDVEKLMQDQLDDENRLDQFNKNRDLTNLASDKDREDWLFKQQAPFDPGYNFARQNILDQIARARAQTLTNMGRVDKLGNPMFDMNSQDDPRELEVRTALARAVQDALTPVDTPSDEEEWKFLRSVYPSQFTPSDLDYLGEQWWLAGEKQPNVQAKQMELLRNMLETEGGFASFDPEYRSQIMPEGMENPVFTTEDRMAAIKQQWIDRWRERERPPVPFEFTPMSPYGVPESASPYK